MYILQLDPKAKDLFDKLFPLYDNMLILVDGTVATGNFVFRPGKSSQSGMKPASSKALAATPDAPAASSNTLTASSKTGQTSGSLSTNSVDHHSISEPLDQLGDGLEIVCADIQVSPTYNHSILHPYTFVVDPKDTTKDSELEVSHFPIF